jgi:hypothetical protein
MPFNEEKMMKKIRFHTLLLVLCIALPSSVAWGQARLDDFAKYNTTIDPNAPSKCLDGQFARFNGSVWTCEWPPAQTCDGNKYMKGFDGNGQLVCVDPQTPTVTCSKITADNAGNTNTAAAANCPGGTFLMTGGGYCDPPSHGTLFQSVPTGGAPASGWSALCRLSGGPTSLAFAWAICCNF